MNTGTTAETSIIIASPTTDNTVSINDHVLNVCPTLIPKYSLTNQNPASFT